MREKLHMPYKKLSLTLFFILCFILIIFYYNVRPEYDPSIRYKDVITWTDNTTLNYLVSSSKCKITDFLPFNKDSIKYYKSEKYTFCTNKKLLTFVNVTGNTATLFVDENAVSEYSSDGVTCSYSKVTREENEKNPEINIQISRYEKFKNNVTINEVPVTVRCMNAKNMRQVYENVHAPIIIDENIKKKLNDFDNSTNTFSVLFLGIDSVSRLNFIRTLPNTYKFVEDNGWIPLKGYNKIEDNTFPNVMAILTGLNKDQVYSAYSPTDLGKLDKSPMLWYDFRDLGYVTSYAEDESTLSTFNYLKKGFSTPPVDYYYRPYIQATERLIKMKKENLIYCTGPESQGERIMNAAKDFAISFKNYPNFGFFWTNSFSHNNMNSPTGMDIKVKEFLEDLTKEGVTENSFVILLSDHGTRFGAIRTTFTGWYEERLPLMYVSIPGWFKNRYPREYQNFRINSHRLTSPYDVYMTLTHILTLSGRNFNPSKSEACPTCMSLFEEVNAERSCEEAGIEKHWCTCSGFKETYLGAKAENKLSEFMLNQIHDIIRSRKHYKCAKYTVKKILGVGVSHDSSNKTYILFTFETTPTAVFESTISYVGDLLTSNFSISGDISRLDIYEGHTRCVQDAYLRKFCYCLTIGEKI